MTMMLTRSRPTASAAAPWADRRARRLKILVVTHEFPALSETFILDQLVALLQAGHDVHIVADAPRHEAVVHPEIAQHDLLRRTRYLAVPHSKMARLALLLRAIRIGGMKVASSTAALILARRRTGEPGQLACFAATVTALAEIGNVDVAICHFGENGARLVRATQALRRLEPVLTIFHGFDLTRLVRTHGPRCYGNLTQAGALFLPTSDAFAERLEALGFPSERTVVQRMCVDLDKLDAVVRALPAQPTDDAPFTFLCVGRLVEKKGFADAVRGFAQAFAGAPAHLARLNIVGDGPLRDELEHLVAQHGVADRVHFLGALPRQHVLAAVRAADVLVHPAITAADGDMEGLPVVISEGMALRKPVITTRHSGIPELVIDQVTGRLVPEADVPALAAAMSWMVAHPAAARRMGETGRARLEAGFNAAHWSAVLEGLLQAAVIAHPGGRPPPQVTRITSEILAARRDRLGAKPST